MVCSDGGRFFSGEPDIADTVLVNIWTAGCETFKKEYVPRNTRVVATGFIT
jgi:hypothetical protein